MTTTIYHSRNTATSAAFTILQRSVCLTLDCHYLGNNRKVDLEDLVAVAGGSVDLDEAQFHATMRLIDPAVLRPVMRVFGRVKSYLRSRAIATHRVFGERSYLIPIGIVEAVDAQLQSFVDEIVSAAVAVAVTYEQAVEDQLVKLGALGDRGLYATPAKVATAFSIDWAYVSFAAPERLDVVSHALAERAQAKYEQRLADAYDEVAVTLRRDALDVVRKLAERLEPGPDGKRRVLKQTAMRDLQEYFALLPARNIVDDGELSDAVARLSTMASGVDVQMLRDDDRLRASLAQAATAAAATLATLVEAAPRRGIRLPGQDVA